MSAPEPLPCLDPPCLVALACHFAGSCRHRQRDAAKSYDLAISEKRKALPLPSKSEDTT